MPTAKQNWSKFTARSISYIGSIGGLLVFCSATVWACWTFVLTRIGNSIPPLSLLEAIGIVAIAYVITSAIEFGRHQPPEEIYEEENFSEEFFSPEHSEMSESCNKAKLAAHHLTDEQRKILMEELEKRCLKKQKQCDEEKLKEHFVEEHHEEFH